jgi:hypothetical protein
VNNSAFNKNLKKNYHIKFALRIIEILRNIIISKTVRKEHACSSEEHGGGWVGSSTKMRQDAP